MLCPCKCRAFVGHSLAHRAGHAAHAAASRGRNGRFITDDSRDDRSHNETTSRRTAVPVAQPQHDLRRWLGIVAMLWIVAGFATSSARSIDIPPLCCLIFG